MHPAHDNRFTNGAARANIAGMFRIVLEGLRNAGFRLTSPAPTPLLKGLGSGC